MMPKIKRYNDPLDHYKWRVIGTQGEIDLCFTFTDAIRYWLWHCGVPAKIAFWGVKSDNSDDK